MKKLFCVFAIILTGSLNLSAQLTEGSKQGVNTRNGLNAGRADVFWSQPTSAPEVIGRFYIDSLWHQGNVKLNKAISQIGGQESDSLIGIMIRYNVLNNELEVLADRAKKDIRVIKGSYLKQFTMTPWLREQTFVNAANYKAENGLTGFCELLASGKLTFLRNYRAKITKPNYNPAFGTGEKNTLVGIAEDYYIVVNGTAEKITPGKKSIMALMKDKQADIDQYISRKNMNWKSEEEVVQLIEYYNR